MHIILEVYNIEFVFNAFCQHSVGCGASRRLQARPAKSPSLPTPPSDSAPRQQAPIS